MRHVYSRLWSDNVGKRGFVSLYVSVSVTFLYCTSRISIMVLWSCLHIYAVLYSPPFLQMYVQCRLLYPLFDTWQINKSIADHIQTCGVAIAQQIFQNTIDLLVLDTFAIGLVRTVPDKWCQILTIMLLSVCLYGLVQLCIFSV